MAIGRISGPMLRSNLERQGVDLSIETDLLYVDVNNNRIGINTLNPLVEFDLNGIARFNNNLQIDGTTISSENVNGNISVNLNGSGTLNISNLTASRLVYAGQNGSLIDNANLTFDNSNLTVNGNVIANDLSLGNIEIIGNTISSVNTNDNIVLDPNGTGEVVITSLTQDRVLYSGPSGSIVDNANLTFNGTTLTVTGNLVVDNVTVDSNTISTTSGNLSLNSAGGAILVETATANRIFYSGTNKEIITNGNLLYNGTTFSIDNISISGTTISNTNSNGNINIDVNGTGALIVDTTSSIKLPIGTTLERPSGVEGYVRYNVDTSSMEFFNGVLWSSVLSGTGVALIDNFNGDGSTTTFTLSATTTTNDTIITLNGVVQSPGNAYTISGSSLIFTEAPHTGDAIVVRFVTTQFTPGSTIADNDTSIKVDDLNSNIVSKINNSNVVVTTASSTTFNGSILGVGSLASIATNIPNNSNDIGIKGEIAYDADYVYICVATNTWIRASIENTF